MLKNKLSSSNFKKAILAGALATGVATDSQAYSSKVNNLVNSNNSTLTGNSSGFKFNNGNGIDSYSVGLEILKQAPIVNLEYKKVGNERGTLATLRIGEDNKSFFLTGVTNNGTDFSAKGTVGYADISGINQTYLGAEIKKAISENFNVSTFATLTHTGSKTLNFWETEKKVVGGTEIWETTERMEGYNTSSVGINGEYFFDARNKASVYGAYSKIGDKEGYKYGLSGSHLFSDYKTELFGSFDKEKTPSFSKEDFSLRVETIVKPELTFGAEYTHGKLNGKSNNSGMITFRYTPGQKKFNHYDNKGVTSSISHVNGADKASKYLNATKITESKQVDFIPDSVSDNIAPVFEGGAKNQTFYLEVGDSVVLENLTAIDDVDGPVRVMRTGKVDTSKPGVYKVEYLAVDKAGNVSIIIYTYIVKEKKVVNPTSPINNTPENLQIQGVRDITLGEKLVLDLSAKDKDGDNLTYTLLLNGIKVGDGKRVEVTPIQVGINTITLISSDGKEESSKTLTFNVKNKVVVDNVAPVFDNGATDKTIYVTVGNNVVLENLTAIDNVDGPVRVRRTGKVDTSKPGTYEIEYLAVDNAGNFSRVVYTYIVEAPINEAPKNLKMSLSSNKVKLGESINFTGSYTDKENDPAKIVWYVNGVKVGEGPALKYVPSNKGPHKVEMVVEQQGNGDYTVSGVSDTFEVVDAAPIDKEGPVFEGAVNGSIVTIVPTGTVINLDKITLPKAVDAVDGPVQVFCKFNSAGNSAAISPNEIILDTPYYSDVVFICSATDASGNESKIYKVFANYDWASYYGYPKP